jgi:hypothetical protein
MVRKHVGSTEVVATAKWRDSGFGAPLIIADKELAISLPAWWCRVAGGTLAHVAPWLWVLVTLGVATLLPAVVVVVVVAPHQVVPLLHLPQLLLLKSSRRSDSHS